MKQVVVDIVTVALCGVVSSIFPMRSVSYMGWIINGIEVAVVWLIIMVIINTVFYKDKMERLVHSLKLKVVR